MVAVVVAQQDMAVAKRRDTERENDLQQETKIIQRIKMH
jgi:hypothetical protein